MPHALVSDRPPTPQEVFSRLARRYDGINRVASLGMDQRWRTQAVGNLSALAPQDILDVCCGTGAMGRAIQRAWPSAHIVGIDINENMLAVARERHAPCYASLLRASAEQLPFHDGSFDCAVLALGFHDLSDPDAALDSLYKVLRPGGTLLLLELTQPPNPRIRSAYLALLRSAAWCRDRVGLGQLGHVIDEVLESPPDHYLLGLATTAGFSAAVSARHGHGVMTSYLLTRPCTSTDSPE